MFPDIGNLVSEAIGQLLATLVSSVVTAVTNAIGFMDTQTTVDLTQPWIYEAKARLMLPAAYITIFLAIIALMLNVARRGAGGVLIVFGRLMLIPVILIFTIPLTTIAMTLARAMTTMITTDLRGDVEATMTAIARFLIHPLTPMKPIWLLLFLFIIVPAAIALLLQMFLRSSLVVVLVMVLFVIVGPSVMDAGLDGLRRTIKLLVAVIAAEPVIALVFMISNLILKASLVDGQATMASALTGLTGVVLCAFAPWLTIKFFDFTGGQVAAVSQHGSLAPIGHRVKGATIGAVKGATAGPGGAATGAAVGATSGSPSDARNESEDVLRWAQRNYEQRHSGERTQYGRAAPTRVGDMRFGSDGNTTVVRPHGSGIVPRPHGAGEIKEEEVETPLVGPRGEPESYDWMRTRVITRYVEAEPTKNEVRDSKSGVTIGGLSKSGLSRNGGR